MKRIFLITVAFAMVCPTVSPALTGLSIGAKVDFSQYAGDVLPESGDVGAVTRYGIMLGFGAVPMLDFELRASYLEKELTYSGDVGGVTVTGDYTFQDASLFAVLKKDLFAPPGSPIGFYLGAGAGLHWMNTDVIQSAASGTLSPSSDPFAALESTARGAGIGLVGLRLSPPMFPLAIFGEGSYEMVFASERINVVSLSVGFQLRF